MPTLWSAQSLFAGAAGSLRAAGLAWLIAVLCTFYVFVHLYAGIYGAPDTQLLNSLHVTLALALVFLTTPLIRRGRRGHRLGRLVDALAVLASFASAGYFLVELDSWTLRTILFRPIDYLVGIVFVLLVLEASRRAVGLTLVVICLAFMGYALTADHFPGMFYGPPVSFTRLLQTLFLGDAGIFGVAVTVMAQYVVLFILFGVLLNAVGGGRFFTRLAFSLFGQRRGGPAKAALVSSAMMGTLSGSAIGNVVTTGIFTIPLMIRLGYRRAFAGAVEAAASNGGMIMPPVMGAVAFIMADLMGRDYVEIIAAAAIPAVIYYVTMFFTVDLEARKLGLAPLDKARLPRPGALLRRQAYYLLPLAVIGVALALGYSIVLVAVVAIGATVAIGLLQRRRRLQPERLVTALEETARSTVGLSATAAAAGIMLGAIFAVGLSFQVSQEAARLAGDNLWLLVLLCGALAVVMGMGMSAPAVYITLAATVVPIMTLAGVPQIAAHFYAFYYGIASNITPPIALTAYAAAPIAGSRPLETGVHAARLGLSSLLLPILFIYHPAILLEGSWTEIVTASLSTALALLGFAMVMTGYALRPLGAAERLVALGGAVLLFFPDAGTDLAGFALLAAAVAYNRFVARRPALAPQRAAAEVGRATGGGWLARRLAGRLSKELEGAAPASGGAARNEAALLASLTAEDPEETGEARRGGWALAVGWLVVLLVAGLFHYAGADFLHARDPHLWTLVMLLAAIVAVSGVWAAARLAPDPPSAVRTPELPASS